jgi:RNA polymerase sigma factor (sigma-70 family)
MRPRGRDPLAHPRSLIERVYAYVAYRVGDGPEAEDLTSEAFERAMRYRDSYDPSKGEPLTWLLAIAKRCIQDVSLRPVPLGELDEVAGHFDVEHDVVLRLSIAHLVARLDERDRELIAMRYGADLTARQMAEVLGLKVNAVEVALHRALERLRREFARDESATEIARLRTYIGMS